MQGRAFVYTGAFDSPSRGLELLERCRDRYPFARVLSHRFPLEDITRAFEHADPGKAIRTALVCAPATVPR